MKKIDSEDKAVGFSLPPWLPAVGVLSVLTLALSVVLMAVVPTAVLSMPDQVSIPVSEENDEGPVFFSHWSHSTYQCYACHPATFPQGPKSFAHDEMDEGRYCGSCHDGKTAWLVEDADCQACHK